MRDQGRRIQRAANPSQTVRSVPDRWMASTTAVANAATVNNTITPAHSLDAFRSAVKATTRKQTIHINDTTEHLRAAAGVVSNNARPAHSPLGFRTAARPIAVKQTIHISYTIDDLRMAVPEGGLGSIHQRTVGLRSAKGIGKKRGTSRKSTAVVWRDVPLFSRTEDQHLCTAHIKFDPSPPLVSAAVGTSAPARIR
jgi:hypothetical protein